MNKEAFLEGRSPLETFIASTLAGGGSFAAMRLLKEMSNQAKVKNQQPGEDDRSLAIDIPKAKVANSPYDDMNEGMNIPKLVALVAGLPAGFIGTKAVYDTVKKKQMQGEIDRANQKYLQTLSNFKQGEASDTPAVDALCAGIAVALEKAGIADGFDFSPLPPSSEGIHVPHEARKAITESMTQNDLLGQGVNAATFGLADDIAPVMGIGALLTALGLGGTMINADRKRKNTEQNMQFPSTVKIREV